MKLNKILMAFAAVAMVGCSSEEVMDFGANQAPEDSRMIQLDENFVIAGVGTDDGVTRTHWGLDGGKVVNQFLPIYEADGVANDPLNTVALLDEQAVGLCWLGQGAVGTDVYTNYEFYHFGWLTKDAEEAEFECGALTNGALYNEINLKAAVTAGNEAVPGTDWDNTTLPGKALKAGVDNLNYNSGIYKTENKAIFGGQYIVYYPYNENFINAGTIPALAVTQFGDGNVTSAPKVLTDPALGHATFRYSAPVDINGGAQAAGFGMKNLSTLVQLKVFTPDGDANINDLVDKIILYSESGKLLKQANLAADKIAAGQKGEALYAETEGTKTIVANFKAGQEIALANEAGAAAGTFITVLPTTVDDLKIFVHNKTDKTWATIDKAGTSFGAGKAQQIKVSVAAADFKSDYIAVDEASLTAALTEARTVAVDAAHAVTIQVIGDITLATSPYNINAANDKFITIQGDDIIVPQDVILNLNTNLASDLRVLGKSCCTGTNGATLNVAGGTLNNVTMVPTEDKAPTAAKNPTVNYTGAAIIAAGKTFDAQAGNVIVDAPVQHKGNITIAEGVTLTVQDDGDLQFMGSTVENNGTIEVEKGGMFDMTDADGNATATDGQRMTNNGKFIHNVDAGVGTAVQSMVQNGEYRCCVDDQIKLSDAYLQWTACSVIEMVNAAPVSYNLGVGETVSYKHNGNFIDIEVNAGGLTTFENPVVSGANGDSKTIQTGKLTVTAGGLNVDFVRGSGKRTLKVNGDMTVKANSQFVDSKAITITENLKVEGAGTTLTYAGAKANEGGLAVTKDIIVDGAAANFDASALNALDITCVNFTLKNGAQAEFGNRDAGDAHNLDASGTISNPAGCKFDIKAAAGANVLAWVTCSRLTVGGTWGAARPRVK